MKNLAKLAGAALVTVLGASAATAAVTVIGTSSARSCYESAEFENANDAAVRNCDSALAGGLYGHERTATYVNRGILYFYRGEFDRAIADFDRAIADDPEEPEAFLNKGVALMRRDQSGAQALPLFTMAIEMGTEEAALAYYARGIANELNGDLTAAYYDIQRASAIAPEWDLPREDLARFIVRRAN